MQLYNRTRENFIASNVLLAYTMSKRMKGLLGRKGLDEEQCMFIKPCNSIHTFFMKFSIDVVFIDKNYKVVKIIEDMIPGKTSPMVWRAWSVFEMPAHRVKKMGIHEGDQLELLEDDILKDAK